MIRHSNFLKVKCHIVTFPTVMLPSSAGHCTCGNSHPVRQKGDISLANEQLLCSTYYIKRMIGFLEYTRQLQSNQLVYYFVKNVAQL